MTTSNTKSGKYKAELEYKTLINGTWESRGRMPTTGTKCWDIERGLFGHVLRVFERGYGELVVEVWYAPGTTKVYSNWADLEFEDYKPE